MNTNTTAISTTSAMAFPSHVFPQIFRRVAEELAAVHNMPPSLVYMAMLAIMSGAVGDRFAVRGAYKSHLTMLNLFVVIAAERGIGKGTVEKCLMNAMRKCAKAAGDEMAKTIGKAKGELSVIGREIKQLEPKIVHADPKDRDCMMDRLAVYYARQAELQMQVERRPKLIIGQSTSEALSRTLCANQGVGFSISSEAGETLRVLLGKYTTTPDMDTLLQAYSGDQIEVERIGRPSVSIERPCLSILWMVQSCLIRELLGNDEAYARGLTARMLVFDSLAEREIETPGDVALLMLPEWDAFITRVFEMRTKAATLIELPCTPEVAQTFMDFNNETVALEKSTLADMKGEFSRARENAAKIAGLFAIAEERTMVTEDCASRAAEVVRWTINNYVAMAEYARLQRLKAILKRIVELLADSSGEIHVGELARRHGVKRDQLNVIMDQFPDSLELVIKKHAGPGRPGEVVKLGSKSTKFTGYGDEEVGGY